MASTPNQIVPVRDAEIGGETVQAVDGRELHQFLDSKAQFATWITERIAQYGFIENQDYVAFSSSGEKGRPRREYAVSLTMAKELAMVERNEKGKQARLYFIECERIAKQANAPMTREEQIAHALIASQQIVTEQRAKIERLEPKALAHDRIADADGTLCITDAAKSLQVQRKDLFSYMRGHRWIYSRPGTSDIAHQDKINAGLLAHKVTAVQRPDGTEKIATQVRVTPKGLTRLAAALNQPSAI